MTPELGRQLVVSIDAAFTSYIQNASVGLVSCMLCGSQILQIRAPYYATIWTDKGTLYYPVCMVCVDVGIAEGERLGAEWLKEHPGKAMTA
jgi:hypothetical protein